MTCVLRFYGREDETVQQQYHLTDSASSGYSPVYTVCGKSGALIAEEYTKFNGYLRCTVGLCEQCCRQAYDDTKDRMFHFMPGAF